MTYFAYLLGFALGYAASRLAGRTTSNHPRGSEDLPSRDVSYHV